VKQSPHPFNQRIRGTNTPATRANTGKHGGCLANFGAAHGTLCKVRFNFSLHQRFKLTVKIGIEPLRTIVTAHHRATPRNTHTAEQRQARALLEDAAEHDGGAT
jgi:hypothetical protein